MAVSSPLRIPRTARVSNEVLNRMGKGLEVLRDVRHLKHKHFGHFLRNEM